MDTSTVQLPQWATVRGRMEVFGKRHPQHKYSIFAGTRNMREGLDTGRGGGFMMTRAVDIDHWRPPHVPPMLTRSDTSGFRRLRVRFIRMISAVLVGTPVRPCQIGIGVGHLGIPGNKMLHISAGIAIPTARPSKRVTHD